MTEKIGFFFFFLIFMTVTLSLVSLAEWIAPSLWVGMALPSYHCFQFLVQHRTGATEVGCKIVSTYLCCHVGVCLYFIHAFYNYTPQHITSPLIVLTSLSLSVYWKFEFFFSFLDVLSFLIFFNHVCADDIDGLAGEEEELAKLVAHLDKASTSYGMEISAEKTKLKTNNTSGINIEIKANGQKLRSQASTAWARL